MKDSASTNRPMPIVADIPTAEPGLGFQEYVDALADAVRGGEPPQFTIGLYGAWGSGKSSLLRAMAKTLDTDPEVLPVLFDAWRHERAEHIIVPLLYRIAEAASRSGNQALTQHLRRAIKALIFSLNFTVAGVGLDAGAAKEHWDSDDTPLDAAFSKPFEELRGLPRTLDGKRVAVLVDDLDRCSPEKVVSLLEAINLVMDVPGFIFVLALDYDVLVKAVVAKYPHVSGHEFIEKMIQLPFRVPPLAVERTEFLGELIPQWDKRQGEFPEGFAQSVMDIADIGLRTNPRQVKRLINSFLVLDRIVEARDLDLDRELMAAMIGLQLRWPDNYQDLQNAVLASDPEPFKAFVDSDEEGLKRYRERFFSSDPENHVLRRILQLTAVVVTESGPEPEKRSARELRAESRGLLAGALAERGFRRSKRSDRLWYHPDHWEYRVAMVKTVFRFERKGDDGDWRMFMSRDFRDFEEGLDWLDQRLLS